MDILARQLDQLGKLSGLDLLGGETPQKASKHMADVLKGLTPEKLGTALTVSESKIGKTALQMLEPLYSFGATKAGARALQKQYVDDAKNSFARNLRTDEGIDLTASEVDKLYSFFDSEIWQEYRRDKSKYLQEDVVTLAREVKQNPNIDIRKFLQIAAGAPSMEEAIAQYRKEG